MNAGFHYLFAGTDDAIRAVITGEERLRSVVNNPGSLEALTLEEVGRLLERRYEHLRHFDNQPVQPPVTPEALGAVYNVFRGNLRGLLLALDEAARILIGRTADPTSGMALADVGPVLSAIYERKMQADLDETQQDQMGKIAVRGLEASFTARQMEKPFGLRYTATNSALGDLVAKGYLEEAGEGPRGGAQGRPSRRFRLTGAGRIALGGFRSSLEPDRIA
jgi:hypothetical protein